MSIAGTPAEVIAQDMRALPNELQQALRPRLRRAGERTAGVIRSRAGWSSRIPGTVKVRTSFSANREGVFITAGGAKAPHAVLYELGQRSPASFRHPIFGRTDRKWVDQATRPFFFNSAETQRELTTAEIQDALTDAAQAIGFGG